MLNLISKLNLYKIKVKNRFYIKDSDIFIASYPRSGNTWLRLLLADIILQLNNFKTDTVLPIHQDKIIPDMHVHDLSKFEIQFDLLARLIKTHSLFGKIKGHKVIFLFRNPADTLCSYFHFHRRYINLLPKTRDGIDKFCIEYTNDWLNHINSYINNHVKDKMLFISYENLHSNTLNTLKKVAYFSKLDASKMMIVKSISNQEFSKRKKNETIKENNNNEYFFRRGEVSSSKKELKPETISFIKNKTEDIYRKALLLENCSI